MKFVKFGLVSVLALAAYGCGGGGSDQEVLTETDAQQQVANAATIWTKVKSSFDPSTVEASLQAIAADSSGLQGVKSVTASGQRLTVVYNNGWKEDWLHNKGMVRPTWVPGEVDIQRRPRPLEYVGAQKAVLINVVQNDERWSEVSHPVNQLRTYLDEVGFTGKTSDSPDLIEGNAATVDAFKKLGGYGLIALTTHGGAESADGRTWIVTGQKVTLSDRIFYFLRVRRDEMRPLNLIITTSEHGISTQREVAFWGLSDKWFAANYGANAFPHSIFYNGACQGYYQGSNTTLASALKAKGVGAYLGWTDSQSLGPWTAAALFTQMHDGRNLKQAMDDMPEAFRVDSGSPGQPELKFFPSAAETIQLTSQATTMTVTIESPSAGSTIQSRTTVVSGTVMKLPATYSATIEVNGSASALNIGDSGAFNQTIALRQGANTIRVVVASPSGSSTGKVNVNAEIPLQALWTELIWDTNNTDVDLHLLPPNASMNDLFTSADCYYGNKNPSWGASLDVDDTSGYGPEHITMDAAADGVYTLVVHYYSDHGTGLDSRAQVFVAPGRSNPRLVGPHRLTNSNDTWTVCEIVQPSGEIRGLQTLTRSQLSKIIGKPIPRKR